MAVILSRPQYFKHNLYDTKNTISCFVVWKLYHDIHESVQYAVFESHVPYITISTN